MKAQNWELKDKLRECVCQSSLAVSDSGKSLYGKYLRAESFRKALVWQKRYLLVLISGEMVPDPVLAISRTTGTLGYKGRFRATVMAIISVSRMKYLVRRWRSGKRAGAHASMPSSRALSQASGTISMASHSPSLSSPRLESNFSRSKSVSDQQSSYQSPLATSTNDRNKSSLSRNPPTFGRSQSFRSSMPRPTSLPGVQPAPPLSPTSNSSAGTASSLVTGKTPPTRDISSNRRDRERLSVPANSSTVRNLGSSFREGGSRNSNRQDNTINGIQDEELRRDLQDYVRRFGSFKEKAEKKP